MQRDDDIAPDLAGGTADHADARHPETARSFAAPNARPIGLYPQASLGMTLCQLLLRSLEGAKLGLHLLG